ncbi:MAG: KH domain-containing protein [Bacilli bacterium]|nr:KH domain-containing protein [Bacilli bacterium]
MNYVKALHDICVELVDDKSHLEVREMPSLEEDTIVLYVYANSKDIAKLIGRKGVVASSIRQLMSVSGRLHDKKLDIKFESYGE